jgi:hypothetical protein
LWGKSEYFFGKYTVRAELVLGAPILAEISFKIAVAFTWFFASLLGLSGDAGKGNGLKFLRSCEGRGSKQH